ncbi:MAG TPA: hypothetical protein VMU92_08130 [Acidobacteriaceae bacterium]|nr:hypothetical protein [Acidobacteriaceae bacterium]
MTGSANTLWESLRSGGPYYYLLEAFGPRRMGRLDSVVSSSYSLGRKAMLLYPPIGEWEPSRELMDAFVANHPALGHLNCCA